MPSTWRLYRARCRATQLRERLRCALSLSRPPSSSEWERARDAMLKADLQHAELERRRREAAEREWTRAREAARLRSPARSTDRRTDRH